MIGNKFDTFMLACLQKKHDLSADTFKIVLTNSLPVRTYTQLSDITQIANGNGYTTGGTATTITSLAQSNGAYKWVLTDVTFTASGGTMADFRYQVLFNDTSVNDLLVAWWDYGSTVQLAAASSWVWDADASSGVLQGS